MRSASLKILHLIHTCISEPVSTLQLVVQEWLVMDIKDWGGGGVRVWVEEKHN